MLSAIFDPFQPLRPSLKGRPSLAAMAVALVATSPAYAAGSGMPWEAPLQKILDSIEGPVAKMVAVYNAQGRDDEAETLYRRALTARERVLGPEHPGTLTSVNNLATLYFAQGRYGEAEPLYRRALTASAQNH